MADPTSSEPATTPQRVAPERLEQFLTEVFQRLGAPPGRARRAAATLVLADRRGIGSHGAARLGFYVRRIENGTIDPRADLTVLRENPATLALDAHDGLGLALAPEAMDRCIAKAETAGVALCTVRNSSHFGIGAAYVLSAAERGFAALAMTNAGPLVAPLFGAEARLGTNPIAFAAPVGPDEPPLVLDMATSAVAFGKIELARRANSAIPPGWAIDTAGAPTTDPFAARSLAPLGGDTTGGGHKGYGLAVMVDMLCGPLAGALWGTQVASLQTVEARSGIGHVFFVWRIDAFRDPVAFAADARALLAALRATPPAPGHEASGVLVPGDPERAAERERRARGIPFPASVIGELRALGERLGVPFELDG